MNASQDFEFADRYINREHARFRFGSLADEYARTQLAMDPLADAVVEALSAYGPGGRKIFETWVETGAFPDKDVPQALVDFAESLNEPPAWADFEKMKIGARAYQRVGPAQMFVLSAWALVNGYHSAPAVKPLVFTGQLEKMAYRRLAETARFLTEVSQVDGMHRFATGFKTTVRVRIMHAYVRRMLLKSGEWDRKAWGAPINQADMAGTIIEFSMLLLNGAREMGFQFTQEESEAIVHLWRYAGLVMGVDPKLMEEFESEDRAWRFAQLIKLIQPGPDADSIALTHALRKIPGLATEHLDHLSSSAKDRAADFITRYHDGLAWTFNGDEIASNLEIPNERWRYAIYPTRAIVRSMEFVRRILPRGDEIFADLGNRAVRMRIDLMLDGKEPEFKAKRVAEDRRLSSARAAASASV